MELNGDESVGKSKTLALKYVVGRSGGKTVRSYKVWKSKEVSNEEAFADNYGEKEMAFIIRIFQQRSRKNKRFSGKSNGFRGSSSKNNIDDQKK